MIVFLQRILGLRLVIYDLYVDKHFLSLNKPTNNTNNCPLFHHLHLSPIHNNYFSLCCFYLVGSPNGICGGPLSAVMSLNCTIVVRSVHAVSCCRRDNDCCSLSSKSDEKKPSKSYIRACVSVCFDYLSFSISIFMFTIQLILF